MNVTVDQAAEKFMRRMVRFGGAGPAAGFRLVVKPGGCSGYAAEFSVEGAPLPGDAVLQLNGLKVFLPAESRVLLDGYTVGFSDTVAESGFTFHNPVAPASACSSHGASTSHRPAAATVDIGTIRRKTGSA